MSHPAMLINRTYNLNQDDHVNWYTSLKHVRSYPSVRLVDFYNTTSSAGDWQGYILQQIKGKYYLILFSQENNYPKYGYTIYTDDHPLSILDHAIDRDECDEIISEYMELLYH